MRSAQREIMAVLLRRIYNGGHIAKSTYDRAVDLVHSTIDFPEFFRYNVCSEKETPTNEYFANSLGDAKRKDDI